MTLKSGQIWENGRSVVQIEKDDPLFEAITFEIQKDRSLRFRAVNYMNELTLQNYLQYLRCRLTEKKLKAEVRLAN